MDQYDLLPSPGNSPGSLFSNRPLTLPRSSGRKSSGKKSRGSRSSGSRSRIYQIETSSGSISLGAPDTFQLSNRPLTIPKSSGSRSMAYQIQTSSCSNRPAVENTFQLPEKQVKQLLMKSVDKIISSQERLHPKRITSYPKIGQFRMCSKTSIMTNE